MEQLLKGKRIYILEDNAENIFVLIKLLEYHGAEPIIAWWFRGEVDRVLSSMPIDLILLDLMLPDGRTGYEALAEIRSVPELATIPAVAVSASDSDTALPKAREAGFNGYISKPIEVTLFPQQLLAVLNGEAVWDGR